MFLVLKMKDKYTAALEVLFSFTGDHDIKEDVKLCQWGHITNYFSTKMNLHHEWILTETQVSKYEWIGIQFIIWALWLFEIFYIS